MWLNKLLCKLFGHKLTYSGTAGGRENIADCSRCKRMWLVKPVYGYLPVFNEEGFVDNIRVRVGTTYEERNVNVNKHSE